MIDFDIKNYEDSLLAILLGGAGQIGMNLTIYSFKGKMVIVDFGAGFADDEYPGVDLVLPDIRFLIKHRKDILGMVLTHAHEDHIGAVQYLWDELKCPIYTTDFTEAFLKIKLRDSLFSDTVEIHRIAMDGTLELGPFGFEFVTLTHSAPEMQGAIITTTEGKVFHTGDWKFDNDPVVGDRNNENRLRHFGDQSILAMVGDSTNVFNEGFSGSEGELAHSLEELIVQYKSGMVIITTFASNLARIQAIANIAKKQGKRIALLGRSFWRVVNAAKETGYLKDVEFIEEDDIKKYHRNEVILLCTGCQGEPMAALSRLCSDSHKSLKLDKSDVVIFSSKIIPGNEKAIFRMYNILASKKIEVVTPQDHFVHVSGHPCRGELKKMYELIRPQIAIPVHGEIIHMHEHARLAKSYGVPKAIEVKNGDVVLISKDNSGVIGTVESGYICVDGYNLLPSTSSILKSRRKMARGGCVMVTVIMAKNYTKLVTDPIISCPGILDDVKDIDSIQALKAMVKSCAVNAHHKAHGKKAQDHMLSSMRSMIRRFFKNEMNKEPYITVEVKTI